MAKYMWQVSYTTEGVKGVEKEGGSSRAATIKSLVESRGGKLDGFYFAFGEDDVIVIADLPSNVEAAATSMAVAGSGAARIKTTVLISPEEIDAATKLKLGYRAPGS